MNDVPIKTRKKLIEVALPLDAINAASVREGYIYRGNPSSLHKWWAQRPLAAARAVIFSQMVDDPSSYVDTLLSEPETRRAAERQLKKWRDLWVRRKAEFEVATDTEDMTVPEPGPEPTIEDCAADVERQRLFLIIEELVKWENTTNETVLQGARDEIWQSWRRACLDNIDHPRAKELFDRHKLPAFNDPFAGGGTLPLEAQRLGLEAYASDLNPVAVLINKAMIEIPPKFAGRPPMNVEARQNSDLVEREWKGAEGLADDVRYYGNWMRDEAEKLIGHLYPKVEITAEIAKDRPDLKPLVGQKLTVIAWLWARTVKSPNPAFRDVDVPLASTFMLSTKPGKEAYADPVVTGSRYTFHVRRGPPADAARAKSGTKAGGKNKSFSCLVSGSPIPFDYIRAEAKAGRMDARLMAVAVLSPIGRVYLSPTPAMEKVAKSVAADPAVADLELPQKALGFRVQEYGMTRWRDLFTARQLSALTTFSDLISSVQEKARKDAEQARDGEAGAYATAISTYLAMAIDKTAEYSCTIVPWYAKEDRPKGLFARHAVPMVWDFAEINPLADIGGTLKASVDIVAEALLGCAVTGKAPRVLQGDARSIRPKSAAVVSTDPPYYDNIGYADLSDFFYVWLRRSLRPLWPELFSTMATPKREELIATPFRHASGEDAEEYFLTGMTEAMRHLATDSHPAFPTTIYYAYKQSEAGNDPASAISTGWETFLGAVVEAGFRIGGTWPIRTERGSRSIGLGTNALASSVVLVSSPREQSAPEATRREFVAALKAELPAALNQLQRSNIAPVDFAQAAIGPGMAVYTRFAKVRDADGKPVSVGEALQLINQVLDEVLANQEGDFDRDTRWAVTWFDDVGFAEADFGKAEQLSKSRNTVVADMSDPKKGAILSSGRGKVRLLKPEELSPGWDPEIDPRLTVWEIVHHLIRVLEAEGENAASMLLARIGPRAEVARELAYRLYSICERKKRSVEALSYNGLVQAWPEISRLARGLAAAAATPAAPAQSSMDV